MIVLLLYFRSYYNPIKLYIMKKRNLLIGLIVFGALTVSGVLLASADGDVKTCDEKVRSVCESKQGYVCYFYLKDSGGGDPARAADRCWYDDHDFLNGGGSPDGGGEGGGSGL